MTDATGALVTAAYTVLALAAGARAAVQITTEFQTAPLSYALSATAAAVYLVAAVALRRRGAQARRVALAACAAELAGVLVVGTWGLVEPASFPDESVWSGYGRGYGHAPLVLPVLGLLWLGNRDRAARVGPAGGDSR